MKITRRTNPNNANQYLLDPRQDECWNLYVDPSSETFSNAYRSAIKAGYKKGTAVSITAQNWFLEKARRMSLLVKGEEVLEKTLDMETYLPVMGRFGPIMIPTGECDKKGTEIKKVLFMQNDKLLKIQQDTAKFVIKKLGKKEGWDESEEDDHKFEVKQIIIINPNKPEDKKIYDALPLNNEN